MREHAVFDTGPGPLRMRMVLDERWYKAMYSVGDWNRIQRDSLMAGGRKFIVDYVPLRFTAYARAHLDYRGKKRKGLPLVLTGRLREYVFEHVKATAVATQRGGTLTINMPTPEMQNRKGRGVCRTYKANPIINLVLSNTTKAEELVVQKAAHERMTELILGSESRTIQRGVTAGQQRMRLTSNQRETVGVPSRQRQGANSNQRTAS